MRQYKIDARIYRKVPSSVNKRVTAIGLNNGVYIKDYIKYFDTLHVLLALSYAEGWTVDYLETEEVFHIGGTSMGSQYAKDLAHMYMSMCFLEHVDHPELTEKYLPYLKPYTSSAQINEKLPPSPETFQMKNTLHKILNRLKD